jgi:hypothetical protein
MSPDHRLYTASDYKCESYVYGQQQHSTTLNKHNNKKTYIIDDPTMAKKHCVTIVDGDRSVCF